MFPPQRPYTGRSVNYIKEQRDIKFQINNIIEYKGYPYWWVGGRGGVC